MRTKRWKNFDKEKDIVDISCVNAVPSGRGG